ncbi:MAG: mannose-6-phosphate isomerase, class I [Microbacteriaceae bacterium]|nr:mannose-6-phosphate isomerase, class I [Microbacteriaceae bacterium]
MLHRIENTPRDYAWGRSGAISALLGRPATEAVEAELWLGAHHGSPSRVLGPGGVPTGETLADAAPELPFLLKVLAAGAPLSIQAHPDAAQAREGFERENALGIPLDAPHRNYRDPFPKPEFIVAVSPRFEALAGFRPAADASLDVATIAAPIGAGDAVLPLLDRLRDDATVGDAFAWLLGGSPEARAAIDAIGRGVVQNPVGFPQEAWIAGLYPGDPGVAVAVLLHKVSLRRGEALYLPAGNVHAYLDGVGIELMVASDNVLRGGLTPKHVDVAELSRVVDRAASPEPRLEPTALPGGGLLYAPDDPEAPFSLVHVASTAEVPLTGPAIVLCVDGAFSVAGEESAIDVVRGDAVLATAGERSLRVRGDGSLFIAR